MDWRPIETMPLDGSRFLVTNGKLFTAAYWYDPQPRPSYLSGPFLIQDNPVAFKEADVEATDWDGNFDSWKPTHWAPLMTPPLASGGDVG